MAQTTNPQNQASAMSFPQNVDRRTPSTDRITSSNSNIEEDNMKFIAKIDDMGSSTAWSQATTIPYDDNDDAIIPPAAPPQAYAAPSIERAPSRSWYEQQREGYPYHPTGQDLDDNEGQLHPFLMSWVDLARGLALMIGAIFKMTLTFTHGLAQTLWHIPFLYGDPAAREPETITGFVAGCTSAAKYSCIGVYDGLIGLVLLPYVLAREDGFNGFIKGCGMGLGGAVFKPLAGILGLIGDPFMGLYKEAAKVKVVIKRVDRDRRWKKSKAASDASSV